MKMPFPNNPNFTATPAVKTRIDGTKYKAIDDVDAKDKRKLWEAIKKHKPETAQVITGSFFAEIKKICVGAKIELPVDEINELLKI